MYADMSSYILVYVCLCCARKIVINWASQSQAHVFSNLVRKAGWPMVGVSKRVWDCNLAPKCLAPKHIDQNNMVAHLSSTWGLRRDPEPPLAPGRDSFLVKAVTTQTQYRPSMILHHPDVYIYIYIQIFFACKDMSCVYHICISKLINT